MHICFIAIDFHSSSSGGGIASYINTIGPALIARGHAVSIIAAGRKKEWRRVHGMQVLFWRFFPIHWYLFKSRLFPSLILPLREIEWSVSVLQAVEEVQAENPIDLIEACEAGNLFLRFQKVPYIVRLHGEQYVFNKYMGKKISFGLRLKRMLNTNGLMWASGISSPSRFQADEALHGCGYPRQKVHIIANPISPSFLIDSSSVKKCKSKFQKVLYTGRLAESKGILVLLKAAALLRNELPDVRFFLVGDYHVSLSKKKLHDIIEYLGIADRTVLTGHLGWGDIALHYADSDLFVMPSYYETFCISCIEAMAMGLPVIATRAGGLSEVVQDRKSGLLVESGDEEALARSIKMLLSDAKSRRKYSREGKKRVRECYALEKILPGIISLYHDAISSRRTITARSLEDYSQLNSFKHNG